VARDVLDQVRQQAVEEDRIGPDRRQFVRDRDRDGAIAEDRSQPVDDRPDGIGKHERLQLRLERSGLDPAEVEDLANEPIEPVCLGVDRGGRRSRRCGIDGDLWIDE
jgi:hypothetical protein